MRVKKLGAALNGRRPRAVEAEKAWELLSADEKNARVAVLVMGWHRSATGALWEDGDGGFARAAGEGSGAGFNPAGCMADAFLVRDRVVEFGGPVPAAFLKNLRLVVSRRAGGPVGCEQLVLLLGAEDICAAAVLAVGG